MLHTYSITGEGVPCTDWSQKLRAKSPTPTITLTHKPTSLTYKLVQFIESTPRLVDGYISETFTDIPVGIRYINADLLNISLEGQILARESATCVSALVETDIFDLPEDKTIYWCEVREVRPGVFEGECWEFATSFVSGHLQPRIQFALDIYKDTRDCPYEHPLASMICADEKKHLRDYLKQFVDKACKGMKKYSQVVVSIYVMSCYYAHDYEISEIMERLEDIFLHYESTSVAAFHDMHCSGAQSNASPSLWFLKIARDSMTREELERCESLAKKFWGWKRAEFKKQRKKMTKGMESKNREDEEDNEDNGECGGEDEEVEEKIGDSPFNPTQFKLALIHALFTEEYLAIRDRRKFCARAIQTVCETATSKLPELDKLPRDDTAGRNVPMLDYDMNTAKASVVFRALSKEQEITRGKASKLKTTRAKTHIPYTRIFFLNSPCVMRLPGYVLNGMHNPMKRFLEFHRGKELSEKKEKKEKKKEGDP